MAKFVIDPGHGGEKNGASYGGVNEDDINLDVSLAMGRMLREKGHSVLYTRDRDIDVPNLRRKQMINEYRPDAFISIHCNATETHKSKGVEAFYRDDTDYPLANMLQQSLAAMTGMKDRGVFRDIGDLHKRLTVLDDSEKIPAALVEIGFLDSDEDRQYLTKNAATVAEILSGAAHDFAVKRGLA